MSLVDKGCEKKIVYQFVNFWDADGKNIVMIFR